MPDIDMMDKECCKTIVEDIKNIKNHRVAIQLKWTSPKPLEVRAIKELIDQHAKAMTTVVVKTEIDDKLNSITIYCSKVTKYKMKSRFGIPIKLVETSKTIVYGFIHELKQQNQVNQLLFSIPDSIKNVCCMFYDCFIEIPPDEASPFT
eukprot:118935_1